MCKQRKYYTPSENVSILKRHFLNHIPISDLCDQYQLQPTVFYRWLKEFFENGASAFQKESSQELKAERKRVEQLQAKLRSKNEVLSELMEEHVKLKKELGEH